MVKAGQSLVQLDDAVDQQTLLTDLAKLKLQQANYDRNRKLYLRNAISKSAFDTVVASLASAKQPWQPTGSTFNTKISKRLLQASWEFARLMSGNM